MNIAPEELALDVAKTLRSSPIAGGRRLDEPQVEQPGANGLGSGVDLRKRWITVVRKRHAHRAGNRNRLLHPAPRRLSLNRRVKERDLFDRLKPVGWIAHERSRRPDRETFGVLGTQAIEKRAVTAEDRPLRPGRRVVPGR